jgi:hypothetical protein
MLELLKKTRNYDIIVAPLKKIESDLSTYIGDQRNTISGLEEEKKEIDTKMSAASSEIKKSEFTVTKISELLSTDIAEDDQSSS